MCHLVAIRLVVCMGASNCTLFMVCIYIDGGTTLPLSESANKFRDHTADMEEGVYDYPIYESAGSYQGTAVDSTSFMLDKQDLNSTSIQSHKLDNPRE